MLSSCPLSMYGGTTNYVVLRAISLFFSISFANAIQQQQLLCCLIDPSDNGAEGICGRVSS